jgi:hypothetical protein
MVSIEEMWHWLFHYSQLTSSFQSCYQTPFFEEGWVDPEDEKKSKEGFKFPWQK